jgi:hypothetical protein
MPTQATTECNRTRPPTPTSPLSPSCGNPHHVGTQAARSPLFGLNVDGTIRTKQGRLISVRDLQPSPSCLFTPPNTSATKTTEEETPLPTQPTFIRALMEYKLHNLKMRYKRLTQRRAKLMRAIRKTHKRKMQMKDTYSTITPPNPSRTQHIVTRRVKLFRTIPGTPDQLANHENAPWMLKLAHLNTSDALPHNIQMWPQKKRNKPHTPQTQHSTLPKLPPRQSTTQSVMRRTQTIQIMKPIMTAHLMITLTSISRHMRGIHRKLMNQTQKALNAPHDWKPTSHA